MPYMELVSSNFRMAGSVLSIIGSRDVARPTAVLFRQEDKNKDYSDFWLSLSRQTTANIAEYKFRPRNDPVVTMAINSKTPITATLVIYLFVEGVASIQYPVFISQKAMEFVRMLNSEVDKWENRRTNNYAVRETTARASFQPSQSTVRSGSSGSDKDISKYNDRQLTEPADVIPHNKSWELDWK